MIASFFGFHSVERKPLWSWNSIRSPPMLAPLKTAVRDMLQTQSVGFARSDFYAWFIRILKSNAVKISGELILAIFFYERKNFFLRNHPMEASAKGFEIDEVIPSSPKQKELTHLFVIADNASFLTR